MPGVVQIPTQAFGGPIEPRGVMSHIMSGQQATMIEWARERPWRTPVSAHFTIGRDGFIAQHAAVNQQAWHAGRTDLASPPTWRLLPRHANPNRFAIGIEHEGFSGDVWPRAQIDATIRVHRWLFAELGFLASEDTVIGHFMTAPLTRAHDPGSGWPRKRIIEALKKSEGIRLDQADYETAALNAYFGVLGHSYNVREDGRWQYIDIRRPKP